MSDPVNNPRHYNQGSIECIDAIEASMTKDQFIAYCKGNIFKYLWRADHKNNLEDLLKAEWYLKRLIKTHKKA
jgi:hypothetical protein